METEWKQILGFEGLYSINSNGEIRRDANMGRHNKLPIGGKLKPSLGKNGYYYVRLFKDGESKSYYIHRLVAETFIGSIEKGLQVNHKNGDKLNNTVNNLEIVTHKQNQEHAWRTGLRHYGEKHHSAKLTSSDVEEIRRLSATGKHTQREIGEMFGVSRGCILGIIYNINWVTQTGSNELSNA
jgi:3-methyladenine DNA glycosylase AlkC